MDDSSSKMQTAKLLLQLSVVLLLVSLSSGTKYGDIAQVVKEFTDRRSSPNFRVPAMFVFGDSVLDAGTNSLFPTLLRANFLPYGKDYFDQPTGRFTNGRTIADYFANFMGIGFPDPYLTRKSALEVINGVNYASAGSGLLRTSAKNKVIPYPDQILQFGQTKSLIEQTTNSELLFSKSIFLISIGSNDLVHYIFSPSGPLDDFIDGLLVILKESVKVLYEAGGRKLMFLGTGPLGCIPGVLATAGITNGQCQGSWSEIGQAYNAALEKFVLSLHETFPEIKAIVGKPYNKMLEFIVDGEKHGFTAGVTACCGSGIYNAAVQCGLPSDLITNPPFNVCDDVDKHVFWDYFHPTDRASGLVAEDLWSGDSSYVAPINLKALVELG